MTLQTQHSSPFNKLNPSSSLYSCQESTQKERIMSYLSILMVSFLATLSLASPVVRQTTLCPWDGTPNASNFTLLSVSKANTSVQKPLALGSNGYPTLSSETWLGVSTFFFGCFASPES